MLFARTTWTGGLRVGETAGEGEEAQADLLRKQPRNGQHRIHRRRYHLLQKKL